MSVEFLVGSTFILLVCKVMTVQTFHRFIVLSSALNIGSNVTVIKAVWRLILIAYNVT